MTEKFLKWSELAQEYSKNHPLLADKLSKFANIKYAFREAEKYGIEKEKIDSAKRLAVLRGELTLEDVKEAERMINETEKAYKVNETSVSNLYEIVNKYIHPDDTEFRAVVLFCNPKVREIFGNRLETLYRAELILPHQKKDKREKKQVYSTPINIDYIRSETLLGSLEEIIKAIPPDEFKGDAEYQRRLRQVIQKKAEKETFKHFKENSNKVFRFIENYLKKEENENIRDVYKKLKNTYREYLNIELKYANPNFEDPKTKKKGVLPSLHQKIGVYHIVKEGRFGIFDGCGTGKTAIASLASPLIQEKLRKEGKKVHGRTIVICPYQAIEAWEKGLAGRETERYFNKKQNMMIIDGNVKKKNFIEELKAKNWIIVNYEQLPTKIKIDGKEKTLAEALSEIGFDYTILDEVHEVKSKRLITKGGDEKMPQLTYSAAARIMALQKDENGRFRPLCLLSGTPIPDNMEDYAIPYHLLMPERCPRPEEFEKLYENNPRILYTFTTEKTLRRKSRDITDLLEPDEEYLDLELDPIQRAIHDYIINYRPKNYNSERVKSLVDPRLVDPQILREIGLLGQVTINNSAKYNKLEEILTSDDGPISNGEKIVIFSSFFKKGITREHKSLKNKYLSLGLSEAYEKLELEKSLDYRLKEKIKEKLGKDIQIEILDGEVSPLKKRNKLSARDKVLKRFRENPDSMILICTTDTGGQSLDLSNATYAIHLDEDYSPWVTEQANARLSRLGQKGLVKIRYLRGKESLDTLITQYVDKKRLIIKMALDGHPITSDEEALFKDSKHKLLDDFVKRNIGGLPVDLSESKILNTEDFETRIIKLKSHGTTHSGHVSEIDYETTAAQEIRKRIWQDPVKCWFDPSFVELYNSTINNLAVYVMQRAKICDLINRAKRKEIEFPKTILADGSGPSLLFNAYQTLEDLIKLNNLSMPTITDRDFSPLMLKKGSNPNKILGNMTGEKSTIPRNISFDMVDNESITLLRNYQEVKDCLIEENRLIKPNGLIELVTKNWKFKDDFYSGIEKLGFKVLSKKNEGFKANNAFCKYLRNNFGEHYADAYASKLEYTYLLLAQKIDNPDLTVSSSNFGFDSVNGNGMEEPIPTDKMIVKEFVKPIIHRDDFKPVSEIKIDRFGNVISYKKLNEK